MKKNLLEIILILATATLFNLIFWQEKMGLNVLIFTVFAIGVIFWKDRKLAYSKSVMITAAGTLLVAVLVVFHNSAFSKIIYLLSFTAFAGFCKEKELESLWHSFLLVLMSIKKVPMQLIKQTFTNSEGITYNLKPAWRKVQISIIPFLILFVFYLVYYLGNPNFSRLSDTFWQKVYTWIELDFSINRLLFFTCGLIISAILLLRFQFSMFKFAKKGFSKFLIRHRSTVPPHLSGMLPLKKEYQHAVLTIISLNLLLFIVNAVDISYVWFGYEESAIHSFKDYVHQGTYLLILSILMAMLVVLFFFRKNLNFFPNNQFLKKATYLWIAQNGILGISLLIRNLRYIDYHGLAYKRIGVLIFLVMVFIGLITMLLKVKHRHSNFFLWHRNSWALYFVMILCSFINWDVMITRYNLSYQTQSEIDFDFLLNEVSDKNIFVLENYRVEDHFPEDFSNSIIQSIKTKKRWFLEKQEQYSLLSWNFTDARNLKERN